MSNSARSMRTVHDYFTRGYRRPRNRLPPTRGEAVGGSEGLFAQFFLESRDDCVKDVVYHCSTCVVLVAYCEYLAEVVKGTKLAEALAVTTPVLIRAFPEVPEHRHDRAFLAVDALRSAVRAAQPRLKNSQSRS
jgi:NifU-like protein involved in Fe-S cluster formation